MNQLTHGILSQFADEAGFLWFLRAKSVGEPHFSLQDLAQLDERLEAQIDGLRVAGYAAWEICSGKLASAYAEELFPAAILAFESNDENRIQDVLDAVSDDQKKSRVLISALGWMSYEQAGPHIERLLAEKSAFHRYIGIAAGATHRRDPGQHLNKAANDVFPLLIARALRAHGELGRSRELDNYALRDLLTDHDDGIRFSAAWSATFAGVAGAVETLKSFVMPDSPYKEKALNSAMRQLPPAAALAWQNKLAGAPETIRLATIGAGVTGNPSLLPWIMEQMKTPQLARVAGEAFTLITGIDKELEEMKGTPPDGYAAGPDDDPKNGNVALDADENLPWPNAELLAAWWSRNKGNYPSGTRYLLGKPVAVDHLRSILKTGLQRQRSAAALELAFLQPGRPLFNVRAPGFRQYSEVAQV